MDAAKLALSNQFDFSSLVRLILDKNTSPEIAAGSLNLIPNSAEKRKLLDNLGVALHKKYIFSSSNEAEKLALIFSKLVPPQDSLLFHLSLYRGVREIERQDYNSALQHLNDAFKATERIEGKEGREGGSFTPKRVANLKRALEIYKDKSIPNSYRSDLETAFKSPALDQLSPEISSKHVQQIKQAHLGSDSSEETLMAIGTSQLALASILQRSKSGVVLNEATPYDFSERQRSVLQPFLKEIFPNGFPTDPEHVTSHQLIVAADLGGATIAAMFNPNLKLIAGTGETLQTLIADNLNEDYVQLHPFMTRNCRSLSSGKPMTPLDCGKQLHHSATALMRYVHDVRETDLALRIAKLNNTGESGYRIWFQPRFRRISSTRVASV